MNTQNNKGFWRTLWSGCLKSILLILGGVFGVFIFLNLSTFLLHDQFIDFVTRAFGVISIYPQQQEMTPEEWSSLQMLIKSGHILPQDKFLSVISEFYNNIINILIVVISFMGIIAYFSIRAISREKAEEIAEKEVKREIEYKLSDEKLEKLLNKNELVDELREFASKGRPKLIDDMKDLGDKIIFLEGLLMKVENPNEEESEKVKIVSKGKNNGNKKKKDK